MSSIATVTKVDHEQNMQAAMKPQSRPKGLDLYRDIQRTIITTLVRLQRITEIFWLFTKDDFDTFVLPNTVFGIVAALVEARCANSTTTITTTTTTTTTTSSIIQILSHIPHTILFNWANLLIFDLANQRLPDSVAEDRINKPWRPLPRGLLTPRAATQVMLAAMPIILAVTYYAGTATESALLMVLTWMYNDLRGGDEHWILRNVIIAAAFFLYNLGSAKVAVGGLGIETGPVTWQWAGVVSGIILTTMHVQDFKDQEGDRVRGRSTAPLVLGDGVARWTFAVPVAAWSVACTVGMKVVLWYGLLVVGSGAMVAWRSVRLREKAEDRRTWKYWCLWCAMMYGIPLAGEAFSSRAKLF